MDNLERYILDNIPVLPRGWTYSWEFEHKVEDGELKVVVTGTVVRDPAFEDKEKIEYKLRFEK